MSLTIPQSEVLARLLDVAQLRHRMISQNLANVNTPGYHQLDVSFEDAFARRWASTERRAPCASPLASSRGRATRPGRTAIRWTSIRSWAV